MRQACALGLLLTLCGCGGGGNGGPTSPTKMPLTLTVTPQTVLLLKIGADQAYTATVHWNDNTDTTETATWSSDNTNVATIDGTGKAHGVDSGEATLIARAQGLTGTLKIRIVPDYQGTWDGEHIIRACTATGDFSPGDWCGAAGFPIGNSLPIRLSLTQDNAKLSGTISLGSIAITLDASSSIKTDGGASMSGQGTFPAEGLTVTVTVNPMALRPQGPSMHGTLTTIFSVPGALGSANVDSELGTVTRTSSTAMGEMMAPIELSRPRDIIRWMRR